MQLFRHDVRLYRKVVKWIPVNLSCLIETMALKLYMKRYNLNFPIFIGVKTKNGLQAHAWYSGKSSFGYHILN